MSYKIDPRIELRGRLDSLNAEIICVQSYSDDEGFIADLEELREVVRTLQRCEAANESFTARLTLWGLDEDEIHSRSHNPSEWANSAISSASCQGGEGHEMARGSSQKGKHIMPHYSMGVRAAEINRLRTLVRECELIACKVFTDDSLRINHVLNRLSSALYILIYKYIPSEYDKYINF
ncbi:MAG: hypothetical protein IJR35_10750 [Synergistaceae bacterium]|nr:hypothetical protein [Synergistaceae bacterium]MBR0204162.1 hypothetical protein [Synergistaceae bacterium]